MIIIVPFVHNWKSLNIFSPAEERAERNTLTEINTKPKLFCLCFLENYYKQVAIENYFSYDIDERAKIIRIRT